MLNVLYSINVIICSTCDLKVMTYVGIFLLILFIFRKHGNWTVQLIAFTMTVGATY